MKKLWGTKYPRLPGRLARSPVSILHDLLHVLELQKNKIFNHSLKWHKQVLERESLGRQNLSNAPERVVITST